LPFEVISTIGGFIGTGCAVGGRPTFQDVANVNVFASQAACGENLVEQLAGGAHKRLALTIFVSARRFADEANFRVYPPDAEDGLRAGGSQLRAASARPDALRQDSELVAALLFGQIGGLRRWF
jgi:hypothetical protein